jgi:electron transport complex protein RnfD
MELRSSPHLHASRSVAAIMWHVVYALLPLCAASVWFFGISALASLAVAVGTCVLAEHGISRAAGRPSPAGDGSVVITGILLALTLPPGFPLWMTAAGGFVGVALGKMLFGGLGHNAFNPALVGRAFLQAAFPSAITAYTPVLARDRFTEFIPSTLALPFLQPPALDQWIVRARVDAFSGATPLTLRKFEGVATDPAALAFGSVSGSAGETSALLVALCGLYLLVRKFADWRIPAGMLGAAAAASTAFHLANPARFPDAVFTLLSGGLMLGAFFMATDMVASPVTPRGVWIYGAAMGLVTVLIRNLGGLPEGVMYAILLGNAVSPIIDNLTQPRVYGTDGSR